METITKPKKWGNSFGIVIPKEIIEKEEITLRDELVIHIEKKKNVDKRRLMKEGYQEMYRDLSALNKEWETADYGE